MWKWIAIVIGLACAGFLALGVIKPEVSTRNSTVVRLTPKDGGTELSFESVYRGRTVWGRSMLALMQSVISNTEDEYLLKLKTLIEKEPAG
jgi:hypothetical protein